MIHRKRAAVALILLAGCFAFYGCPVLVVTGAAVAGGTGTYYYVEGELRTDYYFPVPGVCNFNRSLDICNTRIGQDPPVREDCRET